MADPNWQKEQRDKKQAAAKRAKNKQLAKIKSPEYQEKQRQKLIEQQERAKAKQKKTVKKKSTRGLKGRSATSGEREYQDKIGTLPCIACWLHGRENPLISLHHVYGRTIKNAHKFVLPLCAYHHDTLLPAEERAKYPDMIPIHAKGKFGGKYQFSRHNATEADLLRLVYEKLGLPLAELPEFSSSA
ncbi:recombinase (plasmid) [Vibrio campbellii]|nr:recombinase [Vibrio campbellii]